MEQVSVCIPAYNESRTISEILRYCMDKSTDLVGEILVCANGCTDNTEDIVNLLANIDERVNLLTSMKGKPRAWNTLVRASRYNTLVFFDGDVSPENSAIEAMVDRLYSKEGLILVSSTLVHDQAKPGFEYWLAKQLRTRAPQTELIGGGYVFRKGELMARLKDNGYDGMPEDIEGDDWWLHMQLTRSRFSICEEARIHINAGSFDDYLRYAARTRFKALQFMCRHNKEFYKWKREFDSGSLSAKDRLIEIWNTGSMQKMADAAFHYLLRQAANYYFMDAILSHYRSMDQEYAETGDASLILSGSGRTNSTKETPAIILSQ